MVLNLFKGWDLFEFHIPKFLKKCDTRFVIDTYFCDSLLHFELLFGMEVHYIEHS